MPYSVSPFGIKDTSNTDLAYYRKELITLWYNAGDPYRLDSRTLETRGHFDLQGRRQRRMSQLGLA